MLQVHSRLLLCQVRLPEEKVHLLLTQVYIFVDDFCIRIVSAQNYFDTINNFIMEINKKGGF